jgi:hypothetical protein
MRNVSVAGSDSRGERCADIVASTLVLPTYGAGRQGAQPSKHGRRVGQAAMNRQAAGRRKRRAWQAQRIGPGPGESEQANGGARAGGGWSKSRLGVYVVAGTLFRESRLI